MKKTTAVTVKNRIYAEDRISSFAEFKRNEATTSPMLLRSHSDVDKYPWTKYPADLMTTKNDAAILW